MTRVERASKTPGSVFALRCSRMGSGWRTTWDRFLPIILGSEVKALQWSAALAKLGDHRAAHSPSHRTRWDISPTGHGSSGSHGRRAVGCSRGFWSGRSGRSGIERPQVEAHRPGGDRHRRRKNPCWRARSSRALGSATIPAIGLKPVETGVAPSGIGLRGTERSAEVWEASTTFHVKRSSSPAFHVKRSLYAFPQPVSPHLAARMAGRQNRPRRDPQLDRGAERIDRRGGDRRGPVLSAWTRANQHGPRECPTTVRGRTRRRGPARRST